MDKKIAQIVLDEFGVDVEVKLSRPDPEFGNWATNVALQLAGKISQSPREIAERLAERLRENSDFTEVAVAGPGFINMTLSSDALLAQLHSEPAKNRLDQSVVIETNNPNPFKAMHIGHAFNAILADTIANMVESDGAQVHRVSYHGDVGLHVGKSMYSLLRYVENNASRLDAIPVVERNIFMSRMYAEGSKAYKEDPSAKQEIDQLAQESFQPQSDLYRDVYETCKIWSFEQIDQIVDRLGNKPTKRRFLESEADARGVQTVKQHVPDVFQESDGALVFPGSKYGAYDNAFVASNGHGLYGARDLGLVQLKNEAFHADKSYIVTAEEQRDYFRGVIAAAELCLPELKGVTVNISTGTVKLATGKMSSREGDVLEINWLFDQFRTAIEARGGQAVDEIAAGAMRYQFLKVKIGSDVVFDINEAVSLQGNTGSYLQYAHARARSILSKVSAQGELNEVHAEDSVLVGKLGEYTEVIERARALLEPHHVTQYLFELAQEFNRYYEKNQVIGSDLEGHRAALVKLYADTLAKGLALLGIVAPEKM